MKVLLDPIYTSDPGHCASNAKMKKLVEYILSKRQDVFFYWLVPSGVTNEEMEWYPKSPNIKFLPYPYSQDRVKEYMRMYKELESLIAFDGQLWDIDLIVTNRTTMVPTMKALMIKIGCTRAQWSKKVMVIEDMPLMSFKELLALSNDDAQNLQALAGYVSADVTAVTSYWEKGEILKSGRDYLAPAQLRKLSKSMIESCSLLIEKTQLKSKASIEKMLKRERPFTMAYVGRMLQSQTRIPEIFQIMETNWILRSGEDSSNLRCIISTVSKNSGRVKYKDQPGIPSWIEVLRPTREGFWDLFQNDVDVYLFMSKEEGYSMSLMEPLLLGCPAILIRDNWSVGSVGPDYPFFVNNQKEAYGLLRQFYDDYPAMYKKFAVWSKQYFEPMMLERNKDYVCYVFENQLNKWEADFKEYAEYAKNGDCNEIVRLLSEGSPETINIFESIRRLDDEGKLNHLAAKLDPEFREKVRLGFQTDWNAFRLALMAKFGYRDSCVEVGSLTRV